MHSCWLKGVLALLAIIFVWFIANDVVKAVLVTLIVILMAFANIKCEACETKHRSTSKVAHVVKKATKRRKRR
ncbi:hypothetical protein HY500_01055 [Candidatus Woesearchaeota archaeon]|nr:hypothetical protein [Candidatus Woesearchaeota archaeon]